MRMPVQCCSVFGIPMERKRVFWVCLRKDIFGQRMLHTIFDNLASLGANPMPPRHLDDALPVDFEPYGGDDYDDGQPAKRVRLEGNMSEESIVMSRTFRHKYGLPQFGTSAGSPFSKLVSPHLEKAMTAREMDVVDVAFLMHLQQVQHVPADLVVEVNKTLAWHPWAVGRLGSPGTGSKYLYKGQILTPEQVLKTMGWGHRDLEFPPALTVSAKRRLVGNVISPPVIGGLLGAVLASVSLEDVE